MVFSFNNFEESLKNVFGKFGNTVFIGSYLKFTNIVQV